MKKIRNIIASTLIVLVCLFFLYYWGRLTYIDASHVDRISMNLSEEETATFIKLFNEAKYVGVANGDGGTERYTITVQYWDGSFLRISDFGGIKANFEITLCLWGGRSFVSHYIQSDELEAFIDEVHAKRNTP